MRQFSGEDRVFSNDTRWGAFQRWSKFLGFARDVTWISTDGNTVKSLLAPDPTEAIRRILPSLLDTQPLEIHVLVERIRKRFPVLDGGTYCQQVTERMTQKIQFGADGTAPAVAHALRRLEVDDRIVLSNLADAPRRMVLPDDSTTGRTVSHAALALPKRAPRD